MSNLRSGPTNSFRPTRTTRSTAAASGAGTSAAATTTSSTRPTAASRPPSAAATSRPGSSAGVKPPSRPGSVAGFSFGATRSAGTIGAGPSRASAPPASGGGVTAGVKRKTRTGSSSVEQEPTAAKRPALTSAFSAHVTQTSLNRQLLAAQSQVTELQNTLLNKDREIDRLEADLRLVATREEEEKEARQRAEEELTLKTSALESELSSLKRKFAELESHHEDLDDAYSTLVHTSQSKVAALNVEITTRDEQIELLRSQLQDAQARAREEEIRAKALEELLEQMTEEEPGVDDDEGEEHEKEAVGGDDGVSNANVSMRIEIEEPATSVDDEASSKAEKEDERDELDADADADGEADPEEDPSMAVDTITEGDITPTGDIEISSIRSRSVAAAEPNVSLHEGGGDQPEIEAYPDPGAPPPYTVSSPIPASASIASRSRSASIASSQNVSIASSRAMSLTLDRPLQQQQQQQPTHGTPLSISSSSRLDPLSHIRHRLSLGTPNRRRRRSSAASSHSQERSRDGEILRTELSRLTSHLTSLEASNTRLTSELSRLRSRAQNAEILREEKRELERRLLSMEGLRTRVAELETTALEFAKREKEWELKLRNQRNQSQGGGEEDSNSTPAKTPVGVIQQLTTLRKQHATLLDEHGQLKATLRAYEVELTNTREEASHASSSVNRLQKEIENLQDALTRKEKERVLLERDATFLRSLVSSYQNEETANITVSDDGEVVAAAVTEKLEQRIVQLESLLEEYKSAIESLEGEVERLRRSSGGGGGVANKSKEEWDLLVRKAATLEEAFKTAQSSATQSAERIDLLEQRLFELGGEIGAGRHISPNTRVLTLRQNPAQEWADTRQEVLDKLKAENEALLERLKELESRLSQSGGPPTSNPSSNSTSDANNENTQFVPRASYDSLKHETSSLSSLLTQKEKRLLRLQQVYSSKSIEFREAIESIMGVKLAFYPNGQVRVTSVYDLSAAFVFSPAKDKPDSSTNNENEDGKRKDGKEKGKGEAGREGDEKTRLGARMQLIALGDHVPEELEGLMNMWIRDEMCIPCFMSSVTLECYDKLKREQAEAASASASGMS